VSRSRPASSGCMTSKASRSIRRSTKVARPWRSAQVQLQQEVRTRPELRRLCGKRFRSAVRSRLLLGRGKRDLLIQEMDQ
jgi:hypothetical protein